MMLALRPDPRFEMPDKLSKGHGMMSLFCFPCRACQLSPGAKISAEGGPCSQYDATPVIDPVPRRRALQLARKRLYRPRSRRAASQALPCHCL